MWYDKQDSCGSVSSSYMEMNNQHISCLAFILFHTPVLNTSLISTRLKQPHALSLIMRCTFSVGLCLGWFVDLSDKILLAFPLFSPSWSSSTVSLGSLELFTVEGRRGRWDTRGILACVGL